jgi:bis(5'-nucleosyl)-tetraphosphatase (symmetrical)
MATWVIGDVHGCWRTLERLLDRIGWSPGDDELWMVGDLVNRGPASLEVLRWARANSARLTVVLGNHDLHLLARAAGVAKAKKGDTLDEVLAAPDRDQLLDWLRARPFLHHFGPWVMVHAGLEPDWSIEVSCRLADAAAERLNSPGGEAFLVHLYSRLKESWHPDLEGDELTASAAAVFTRMRMVGPDGRARLEFNGPIADAPEGWKPWFMPSAVRRQGYALIFGHWALLGFYRAHDIVCLDSGCVYGGSLSALRLKDGRVVREKLADKVVSHPGRQP